MLEDATTLYAHTNISDEGTHLAEQALVYDELAEVYRYFEELSPMEILPLLEVSERSY